MLPSRSFSIFMAWIQDLSLRGNVSHPTISFGDILILIHKYIPLIDRSQIISKPIAKTYHKLNYIFWARQRKLNFLLAEKLKVIPQNPVYYIKVNKVRSPGIPSLLSKEKHGSERSSYHFSSNMEDTSFQAPSLRSR